MGTQAYLWLVVGTTWQAYNPVTGDWMFTMTGVPASFVFGGFGATTVRGPRGEILTYTLNMQQGWMRLWNSTAIPALFGSQNPGDIYNWNVWIPTGLTGSVQAVLKDRIIGASISSSSVRAWGLSLESSRRGQLLFDKTWTPPSGNQSIVWVGANLESGVF